MKPLSSVQKAWQYSRSLKKRLAALEAYNLSILGELDYWKLAYNTDFVAKAIEECEDVNNVDLLSQVARLTEENRELVKDVNRVMNDKDYMSILLARAYLIIADSNSDDRQQANELLRDLDELWG